MTREDRGLELELEQELAFAIGIAGVGQGDDRAGEEEALSRAINSSALCCLYLLAPILRMAFLCAWSGLWIIPLAMRGRIGQSLWEARASSRQFGHCSGFLQPSAL